MDWAKTTARWDDNLQPLGFGAYDIRDSTAILILSVIFQKFTVSDSHKRTGMDEES